MKSALRGMTGAPVIRVVASPESIGLRPPVDTVPSGVTLTIGDIYVFQSGVGSVLDVDLVVFHEVFHKGLQNVMSPADYVATMQSIASQRAMIGARIANLSNGQKTEDTENSVADFFGTSPRVRVYSQKREQLFPPLGTKATSRSS